MSHDAAHEAMEKELRAQLVHITGGFAPEEYAQAWWDWFTNLARTPDKQAQILADGWRRALDNWQFAARAATAGKPLEPTAGANDLPAPKGELWNQWPFNVYAHAWGNWAGWLQESLGAVSGVAPRSVALVDFTRRQATAAASPANFLATNPELLEATRAEQGANLVRGLQHWLEDASRLVTKKRAPGTEKFAVGRHVAVTPGKVVMRNELIELIQYAPATADVYAEPVLITPAWIMKYYILDLSPHNSLVRFLVERGHTVFVMSWKNPTGADRNLGMQDYVKLGFEDALDVVGRIVPGRKVHAVGYCIGGTLLAIAAARLAARGDTRIASVSMFAAQTDFSEPGELSLFISPQQLAMVEGMMHRGGVLESERMGGAFALLRANDLIWGPAVDTYVRGRRGELNDLMAWNADGTRMPARMHSEYLYGLYLENALAGGEFRVGDERIDLTNIEVPMFLVGTETDHVAPWKSVFKTRGLTRSPDYTFLLTSGGHNAGIVSGPVHPKRRYRMLTWKDATSTLTADEWLAAAPLNAGSWWPAWQQWLADHSSAQRVAPPAFPAAQPGGAPLTDAPGGYVHG